MAKATLQQICPHESDTVPILQEAGCAKCIVCFADRLLYAPWTSEWIEFHNAWKINWTGMSEVKFLTPCISDRMSLFFDDCSTPWKCSLWLSVTLKLSSVITQTFRLYSVSCFETHKTDGIHPLLNTKFPSFQHRLQYIFKILKHTILSYQPSFNWWQYLTLHQLTIAIKHIFAVTHLMVR